MANLYRVDSPINREQRNNLNLTFEDILSRFTNFQRQLNILAGDEEVDVLLQRITDAINNAESTTADLESLINVMEPKLVEIQSAIDNANGAADDANVLNIALTTLKGELETLQTDLNSIVQAESQRVVNESQRIIDEQARINAESARVLEFESQNQLIDEKVEIIDSLIDGLESFSYSPSQTYNFPNFITHLGNTFIALKEVTGISPTNDGVNYRLIASKGDKGETGAALSILDQLTNESQLPPTGNPGEAYTINGELWVWSENSNQWINVGNIKGEQGLSAYQVALAGGFVGTQAQWLESLKGTDGITGADGKNAYQVAVANGYVGTEVQWIASLKGEKGDKGEQGLQGVQGIQGPKGDKGDTGLQGPAGSSADVPNASTTVAGKVQLNDTLTSTSVSQAATANAVKNVNDKLIGSSVAIGKNATANLISSVAIGENADSTGLNAASFGINADSSADYSAAIGRNASAINKNEGVFGASSGASATTIWKVPGSFSVTGTKNFEMPHPNPTKKATHVIRHGAVESPTAGDTLYRYTVEAQTSGETVELQLPDYFEYLNANVDVWLSPHKHFGRAYGEVIGDKLYVTCETAGIYKALVIGTRNDDHESVQTWHIKGVEREIGESWTGETYVFEVEEITELEEIKEVTL